MGAEGARAMMGDRGDTCKDESVTRLSLTRQQQITSPQKPLIIPQSWCGNKIIPMSNDSKPFQDASTGS